MSLPRLDFDRLFAYDTFTYARRLYPKALTRSQQALDITADFPYPPKHPSCCKSMVTMLLSYRVIVW